MLAQVQHVRAKVSARILSDRGLSPEVLDALSSSAQRALYDREASLRTRRARQAIRSELAAPCGRLVDELRRLVAAVAAQRASDPTLPSIASPYAPPPPVRARKPARKPADPPPVA